MLERVASYIWGTGLLVLLLGTGLYLSFRLRFFQFWGWKTILRRTFGSLRTKSGKGGTSLTQFQTFSTALAAAMGTGNILGVAAALCLGGAGAIFWMWVSALLGMALTYSENVLALRYARTLPDGTKTGGPMAYLRFGLHSPVLAVFYSLCCIGASLGMGNMTQSSAISTLAAEAFSLPPLWTGIGVTLLLGIILLRGTRSTGKVIQWLMPVLSAVYLLAAAAILLSTLLLPMWFCTVTYCVSATHITRKCGIFFIQEQVMRTQALQFSSIFQAPFADATGMNFIPLHAYGGTVILSFLSSSDAAEIQAFLQKTVYSHRFLAL